MSKNFSILSGVVIALILLILWWVFAFHRIYCEADEEVVPVSKPWIFGDGGVYDEVVTTGAEWFWASTEGIPVKIVPVKHQVDENDLFSDDNTPLDYHTVIITQVQRGKSPVLIKNYGQQWFENNILSQYENMVRDYVSRYNQFDLMSNREVLNEIDEKILADMRAYVKELSKKAEFPVDIVQVIIGKAIPNEEQLQEMNQTARAVQAKKTQEREAEVQAAREIAERQRAKADKAYREELGLNVEQFISLKWIETIQEKNGANIDVMVGPATSMWNVRR